MYAYMYIYSYIYMFAFFIFVSSIFRVAVSTVSGVVSGVNTDSRGASDGTNGASAVFSPSPPSVALCWVQTRVIVILLVRVGQY